ncbi:MAG: PQQ-binding-like beta-propeller repeat protein [Verrucomicrobiales bacterium]|nr:PQQ-binding-like beta-propeller repeat protein [Verrucomicrobiales bacterium]
MSPQCSGGPATLAQGGACASFTKGRPRYSPGTGRRLGLSGILGWGMVLALHAAPVGHFISAPDRRDLVHDAQRGMVYISSGDAVLRFDLATRSFLAPWVLGGHLQGIDLSPDGQRLAVADAVSMSGSNWVHHIDLVAHQISRTSFAQEPNEAGTFSVAYGADHSLWISSSFNGSGTTPLRRLDPETRAVENVREVRGNTMLMANVSRRFLGFMEPDNSLGPMGRIEIASPPRFLNGEAHISTSEIAISRDGSQLLVPSFLGAEVWNESASQLRSYGRIEREGTSFPFGAAYHATADAFFTVWVGSGEVRAHHSVSLTELGRYEVDAPFSAPGGLAMQMGRMRVSADGAWVFVTVSGGIRYFQHGLAVPHYEPRHQLLVEGNPARIGTPLNLGYGVHWLEGTETPRLTNAVPPVADHEGTRYRCVGWTGSGSTPLSGSGTEVAFDLNTASVLTWNWEATDYALTITVAGEGTVDATGGWVPRGTPLTLTASPAPGHRFLRWSGDVADLPASATPRLDLLMDRPRHVVAEFEPDVVELFVTGLPIGVGASLPLPYGRHSIQRGTVVTNTALPVANDGSAQFRCSGWEGTGDVPPLGIDTNVVFTLNTPSQLTWRWELTDYLLSVAPEGPGTVNGPASPWVPVGAEVTLLAQPSDKARFVRWQGSVPAGMTTNNPLVLVMDQARFVRAQFATETWDLRISSDPAGVGASSPLRYGTNRVARGSEVTNQVPALATVGSTRYRAAGWSGDGSVPISGETTRVTFTLRTNSSLVWKWVPSAYRLSTRASGNGQVLPATDWQTIGSEVRVEAQPDVGHRFSHWNGLDAGAVSNLTTVTVVMDTPRSLVAVFLPDTLPLLISGEPSPLGMPSPLAYGSHSPTRATLITNEVATQVESGGVRWLSRGWKGTGSVPASGTTNRVVFALTEPSSLTWLWESNALRISAEALGVGTVLPGSDWVRPGTWVTNFATPGEGHRFVRWYGDVPPGQETNNPLVLEISSPRTVGARFVPESITATRLAGNWPTFGGGTSHNGYFQGTLGSGIFHERWARQYASSPNQVAVGGGRVFLTPYTRFGELFVEALSAGTGDRLWRYDLPAGFAVNPPSWDGTEVYVQRGNHADDTHLWKLDAASGRLAWRAPHGAQWDRYMAPVVTPHRVFVTGGFGSGLYGFDRAQGTNLFFVEKPQIEGGLPTVHQDRLFSWMLERFSEHDPASGEELWSLNIPGPVTDMLNRTVAASGSWAVLATSDHLIAIDLNSRSIAWDRPGTYLGTPAVAHGLVFAAQVGITEVLTLAGGVPLGSFEAPTSKLMAPYQPVVLDDVILVPTDEDVRVIDLATFTPRQILPRGGQISIADGVLYIASPNGVLRAYSAGEDRRLIVTSSEGEVGAPYGAIYGINQFVQGSTITARLSEPMEVSPGVRRVGRGWSATGSPPPSGQGTSLSFVLDSDSTLHWLWKTQYLAHVEIRGAGKLAADANLGWRELGDPLELTALPDPYHRFSGWIGDLVSSEATLHTNLTGALQLTAVFEPVLLPPGLPAWWLAQHGLMVEAASVPLDSDGDGHSNWQEWQAGTNPTDPLSILRLELRRSSNSPGFLELRWPGIQGHTYRVLRSLDGFAAYQPLVTNTPTTSAYVETLESAAGPAGTYLLEVEPASNTPP